MNLPAVRRHLSVHRCPSRLPLAECACAARNRRPPLPGDFLSHQPGPQPLSKSWGLACKIFGRIASRPRRTCGSVHRFGQRPSHYSQAVATQTQLQGDFRRWSACSLAGNDAARPETSRGRRRRERPHRGGSGNFPSALRRRPLGDASSLSSRSCAKGEVKRLHLPKQGIFDVRPKSPRFSGNRAADASKSHPPANRLTHCATPPR